MDMQAFVRALHSGRAEEIAPFIDEIRGGGNGENADVYTKDEIDKRLSQRPTSRSVYSKDEIDEMFAEMNARIETLKNARNAK